MFHKNIHTVIFDGRPERTICDAVLQCGPGTLRFPAQPLPCTGENRGRRANLPCENTGRCAELLLPGAPVWLQRFGTDAKRKTKFDLIAVQKGALLLNIDSQAPNAAAREFLASGGLGWIPSVLRPEYTWGDSRFDFYLEHGGRRCLAEVKGVTLEEDGTALFPDAPTLRGIKHLEGLSRAAAQGFACCVLFVVQFSPAAAFAPNRRTHPAFADALRAARDAGVRVLAYDCAVTPESMVLRAPVPVTGL